MLVSWFCVQVVSQHCSIQTRLCPPDHCWFCAQQCSGEFWWGKDLRILPQINCLDKKSLKWLHGTRAEVCPILYPLPHYSQNQKICWTPPDSLPEVELNSSTFALHLCINRLRFWKNNRGHVFKARGFPVITPINQPHPLKSTRHAIYLVFW